MTSSRDIIKPRGRPPTGRGEAVLVRLQPDLLSGLDELAAKLPDSPSRPEAIRRVLAGWLAGAGVSAGVSGGMAMPIPSVGLIGSLVSVFGNSVLVGAIAKATDRLGVEETGRLLARALTEDLEAKGYLPKGDD